MRQTLRPLLPPLVCFLACLGALVALSWPMPAHLGTWHLLTAFGDSHAWVFEWLRGELAAGRLPVETADAGYPQIRAVRLIGWAPAALFMALRLGMGALAAANLVQLLSLPVSALAAGALIRRWTEADPWVSGALGVAWALSPTLLSTYGLGEISNTQAWVLPGCLWLMDRAEADPRWLPALALGAFFGVFSSPYFGLALPLLAGGLAVARALRPAPGRSGRARFIHPGLMLAAVALGLAPSGLYYMAHDAGGGGALFRPAQQTALGPTLPFPPPVARPDALVWAREPAPRSPFEPMHASYLGLPLLLAAGLSGRRPGKGRGAGVALFVGGALLSLGPWLAWGTDYVRAAGLVFPLPARLLELLGYPTRQGGLYFRYAVIAELWLVLLVAAGLAGRRRAGLIAGALTLLHVADGVRATGPLWPRPSEAVPEIEVLREMAGSDGAVLELPLQGPLDAAHGQGALLRALFHRRPTSALPRDVRPKESVLPGLIERGLASDPAEVLAEAGFRYVLLPDVLRGQIDPHGAALIEALGPPQHDGAWRIWDLGPTRLAPQRASMSYQARPARAREPEQR